MALEQVFICSHTLKQFREGPLGQVREDFCQWLLKTGFAHSTIRRHISRLSHLSHYLDQRGLDKIRELTSEHIREFLSDYLPGCKIRHSTPRYLRRVEFSLNRFMEFLQKSGIVYFSRQPEVYQPLLDKYLHWMKHYHHSTPGTLDRRCESLLHFLKWLGAEATPEGVSRLSAEKIQTFFLNYSRDRGRSPRRAMQSALRTFLRFCHFQEYISLSLDHAIPTLRTYKLARLPRGLTDIQARKVLGHIERDTVTGRRDYAIIQLLYTYGVRGGQVRTLRLEDINWAQSQIRFPSLKGGKDCLLPLTNDVGESLLDYLQHARPQTNYPEVFLTTRAPYHPLEYSSTLAAITERHIRSAGINNAANRGAHGFRHSFATRMLAQGRSLKSIADMLGHRHIQTTFIYTKVDFKLLNQVALDWPEVQI